MNPYIAFLLSNFGMLFTDATLVAEWVRSLKARGVDVEAGVAAAIARSAEDTKRLLASLPAAPE